MRVKRIGSESVGGKKGGLGRIHLRIHSLKRYLFAPLFVENARKTKTGIPALFALMGTKISSFET
ncbi:MAG: hypothetical protein IKS43_00200, partial [Clostridia bacterium]|nr:hypothetical protein [Clostridia bacterium]